MGTRSTGEIPRGRDASRPRRDTAPGAPEIGGDDGIRTSIDRDRLAAFCRKWRVKELALFGSVLREDFGPESDVDVLVELHEDSGVSLFDWVDMIEELKGILGRDVDLVSKRGLRNPYRRHEILSTARVIYDAQAG